MFYAKLKQDGSLDRYPYTLTDLRRDNPNTSFLSEIDDATAAFFGAVPVRPADPPPDDHTVNLARSAVQQGSEWIEVWISTPATQAEITERTAAKANDVRSERNSRLSATDWTQLPDAPPGTAASWTAYRQALRDVPAQPGFPWAVTWPVHS